MNTWDNWNHSRILTHENCILCELSRKFILNANINSAKMNSSKYSSWMNMNFHWGAVMWPLFWCDIPKQKVLDCGAFSALTLEYIKEMGGCVYPVQFILEFDSKYINAWDSKWRSSIGTADWINNDYVYHELVGLYDNNGRFIFWDITDNLIYDDYLPKNLIKFRILSGEQGSLAVPCIGDIQLNRWVFV